MNHDCDRHDPGTLSCWVNCSCRCQACCFESSEYNRALYRGERRNVPVAEVQPLLADLRNAGWEQQKIAAELDTARQVIGRIEHGRVDHVRRATAEAIRDLHDSLGFMVENVRVPVQPIIDALRVRQLSVQGTYDAADRRALYRGKRSGWLTARVAERLASRLGHNLSTLWPHDEWESA